MICIPRDIGPICPSNLTSQSNDFWLEKLSNNDSHKVSYLVGFTNALKTATQNRNNKYLISQHTGLKTWKV